MHHMAVIDNSSLPWIRDKSSQTFTIDAHINSDLRYHIYMSNYFNNPYIAYQINSENEYLHRDGFDTLIQAVRWCENLDREHKPKSLKDNVKIIAGDYEINIGQRDKNVSVDFCKPFLSAYTASFDLTPDKARELAQSLIDFADIMDIKGVR